jgi:hypothetical protein
VPKSTNWQTAAARPKALIGSIVEGAQRQQ